MIISGKWYHTLVNWGCQITATVTRNFNFVLILVPGGKAVLFSLPHFINFKGN